MIKISQEEVINIAKMSAIDIHQDEIQPIIKQLDAVLSYAERVQEIAGELEEPSNKNVNVFREDVVVKIDYQLIMELAPKKESNYFVVPAIIEK